MRSIGLLFTDERNRGPAVFGLVAVLALIVAVAAVVVASNSGNRAIADSPAAPAAVVPQDPPSSNSVFVKITANDNDIEGESWFGDREDWTDVLEYNHSISRDSDRTGSFSAARVTHNAVVFTKHVDKSSPLLMQAMINNDVIGATFQFERSSVFEGTVEFYYEIELMQGRITGIRKNAGLTGGDTETISIAYTSIRETNVVDGVEFMTTVQTNS